MIRALGFCLVAMTLGACAVPHGSERAPTGAYESTPIIGDGSVYRYARSDDFAREGAAIVAAAHERVVRFWGRPFAAPIEATLVPTRAQFNAAFPPEWGMSDTQCWIVGVGTADLLVILSPTAWRAEACEHDPDDAQAIADLVAHELAHVHHGQHNVTRDFTGAEEIGWFIEGIGVLVSGQLEHGHLAEPREAIETGHAPARLEDAWSGKYRYGVSGSLVAYIDERFGRDVLFALLSATTEREILDRLGVGETELLSAWRDWAAGKK